MNKLVLIPKPPYNFSLSMSLFSRFSIQVCDYFRENKYYRLLDYDKKLILITIQNIGSINKPALQIDTLSPKEFKINDELISSIKRILGCDFDLTYIYKIMDKDPITHYLKKRLFGFKIPNSYDIFEALIIAILEQQISYRAALSLRNRFVINYGKSIQFEDQHFYSFPKPRDLINVTINDLRALGLTYRKSHAIRNIIDLIISGKIAIESFYKIPQEEIVQILTQTKGIGEWTVNYMLCRGAGRYKFFSNTDAALINVLGHYNPKENVESIIKNLQLNFGDFFGYVALYLIYSTFLID